MVRYLLVGHGHAVLGAADAVRDQNEGAAAAARFAGRAGGKKSNLDGSFLTVLTKQNKDVAGQ